MAWKQSIIILQPPYNTFRVKISWFLIRYQSERSREILILLNLLKKPLYQPYLTGSRGNSHKIMTSLQISFRQHFYSASKSYFKRVWHCRKAGSSNSWHIYCQRVYGDKKFKYHIFILTVSSYWGLTVVTCFMTYERWNR